MTDSRETSETGPQEAAAARTLRDVPGVSPVAAFLLRSGDDGAPFQAWPRLEAHRYCQAVMRARSGESVVLEAAELACPAAARAFGFRPLPPKLASGEGLEGFGIAADPATARSMFGAMPHLEPGSLTAIAVCPLEAAPRLPDAVVVEGEPEALMWLLLGDVNVTGGGATLGRHRCPAGRLRRRDDRPGGARAPQLLARLLRVPEATDMAPGEAIVGFPGILLQPLCAAVEQLALRAIPRRGASAR